MQCRVDGLDAGVFYFLYSVALVSEAANSSVLTWNAAKTLGAQAGNLRCRSAYSVLRSQSFSSSASIPTAARTLAGIRLHRLTGRLAVAECKVSLLVDAERQ